MAADKRLQDLSGEVSSGTISTWNWGRFGWCMGTMSGINLGEAVIRSVDWSRYRLSTGSAERFGDTLLRLVRAATPEDSREVWNGIENSVIAQDTMFSAAEPTIDVILAALAGEIP